MSSPLEPVVLVEYVPQSIIRDAFNAERIVERARQGELREVIAGYNTHLHGRQRAKMNRDPRTQVRFTLSTRSQMVSFYTPEGKLLATGHRYLRRDGGLAGSGMVNPKTLFLPDRILAVRRSH